jgi:outer membrane protein insertion porin family
MSHVRSGFLVAAAALLAVALAVTAQAAEPVVTGVTVVGARAVSAKQVSAWSGIEAGKPFSRDAIATGIRRLFATEKFADVYVYAQPETGGVRLLVNLTEFPRIRLVAFKGNHKVKKEDLAEAFPPTVGQFANPAVIARELGKIRELYYDRGYYDVSASADSLRADASGLADVVVQIVEGKKVKTRSISFSGIAVASADDLRGAMKQKTGGFLRSGAFKKKQFEEDRERILGWYRDRGFLDVAIPDVEQKLADDREHMDLIIHVAEGKAYRVGDINWHDNKVFDDATIADRISMQKGKVFSEGD